MDEMVFGEIDDPDELEEEEDESVKLPATTLSVKDQEETEKGRAKDQIQSASYDRSAVEAINADSVKDY